MPTQLSGYSAPGRGGVSAKPTRFFKPAATAQPAPTPAAPSAPTAAPSFSAQSYSAGPAMPARPAGPDIGEYNVNESAAPELVAARQRAEKYLGELETGTGAAMEVTQSAMQSQIDSDVARARDSAQQQGIPFDEAAYRRQANEKMQASLADEKKSRDTLRGNQMQGLLGTIGAGESSRMAKNAFELERKSLPVNQRLQKYGTEAGIYGQDVGAASSAYSTNAQTAIASMNALNQFLSSAFSFSA